MLLANVRFALLFSTLSFRLVEIGKHLAHAFCHLLMPASDSRLEQGHVLLVSPAFWLSTNPPEDLGTPSPSLDTKPLPALLTAMVLAGLRHPVIHPAACDLGSLGPAFLSFLNSTTGDRLRPFEVGVATLQSCVSREQVRLLPVIVCCS
jgi:hypothetical protein